MMPGHLEFEFDIRGQAAGRRDGAQPFNLLILGNFSGRPEASAEKLTGRRIVRVDLDSREQLWSLFAPALHLAVGQTEVHFAPRDLDDFHPDTLFRRLPVFQQLRRTRAQLLNPDTARATLDEILQESGGQTAGSTTTAGARPESGDELFERLLGKPAGNAASEQGPGRDMPNLESYIRRLIAPHVVRDPDPRAEAAVTSVDLATAALMRKILHHPEFQALEASWQSLMDLVSEVELDEELRLFVCDVGRQELLAALPDPGQSLQDSDLFSLLVAERLKAADDAPWSLIIGDYYFGVAPEDVALLTALGAIAAVHGAAFLGGAQPALLGCRSAAELADTRYWNTDSEGSALWRTLRRSVVAPHLGLALPRVLGRLPFGADSDPVESFEFEEMPARRHENYLWTNPAYACARILAQGFQRDGWQMQAEPNAGLGTLPAHHYFEDGESRLQPCAEVLLPESTMVAILEQGLMPIVSYRNQNTAALGRFQSIAEPLRELSGPWAGKD